MDAIRQGTLCVLAGKNYNVRTIHTKGNAATK